MKTLRHSEESVTETLILEKPRSFDSSYQTDAESYKRQMELILQRLAVRATGETKAALQALKTRIINRGKTEAFVLGDTAYTDIALLDLLSLFALEYGIAEVKSDGYHILEFEVAYSVALHTDKRLEGVNPYNHTRLTDEQFRTLWADVLTYQNVFFSNALAFVVAHELGHLILQHQENLNHEFPSEETREGARGSWDRRRREMELEADRFAAEFTLNALFQPANILPWFGLNEVRRSYYGVSREYPSPGQREAAIRAVYEELQTKGTMATLDVSWPEPLAPHSDMRRVDRIEGLKRIREVRDFRREFLAAVDEELGRLLSVGVAVDEAVSVMTETVERNKGILQGSCKDHSALSEVLLILDAGDPVSEEQVGTIRALIEKACPDSDRLPITLELLDCEPVDWSEVKNTIRLMTKQRPEFAMAIEWKYMLANTRFRWEPTAFDAYVRAVNAATNQHFTFKPYNVGVPLRRPPPAHEDVTETLLAWDGIYDTIMHSSRQSEPCSLTQT